MIKSKLGFRTADLSLPVRLCDITEELFDELVDEDVKAELIDGVMLVHSPATVEHDDIGGFLRWLMRGFARKRKLGIVLGPESMIRISSRRKFAPDIYYVEHSRVPTPLPKKEFPGAPDHITEVLSPSTRKFDLNEKRRAYRKARVREIWFVDPENCEIIVDRLTGKGYRTTTHRQGKLTSTALAGFWIDVAWLFGDELPDEMECLHTLLK